MLQRVAVFSCPLSLVQEIEDNRGHYLRQDKTDTEGGQDRYRVSSFVLKEDTLYLS